MRVRWFGVFAVLVSLFGVAVVWLQPLNTVGVFMGLAYPLWFCLSAWDKEVRK